MTDLKPCPFCGGEAELTDRYDCEECSVIDMCDWHDEHGTCKGCEKHGCWCCVVCDFNKGGCGATGGWRDNPDAAIAAWNSRAERTCKMRQSFIKPSRLDFMQEYLCSECDEYSYMQIACDGDGINYCPNCGARVIE